MDGYVITRHGMREYATKGETSYKRRIGSQDWTLVEQAPTEKDRCLTLIRHCQADGEPYHWSLFVAYENERGSNYEVSGDAELMHHQHTSNVDILSSSDIKDTFTLAYLSDEQARLVEEFANTEIAPSAPNRASVKENCQWWAIRVLERLKERGIVTQEWVTIVKGMLQPINGAITNTS